MLRLARIHAPIGLEIGAISPAEIAVAIMGEITARLRRRRKRRRSRMKFGSVPLAQAEGAVAVHSIRKGDLVLKKGTMIGKAQIAALANAGIGEIVVARIEPGDVSEDTAAADIAAAVRGGRAGRPRLYRARQSICAKLPACWWSTRPGSIASTRLMNPSRSRRFRPTSRWLRAR